MDDEIKGLIGKPFDLAGDIDYSSNSVVSKTLMDKGIGTITLFSFDAGQGLSEHTSPYDAVVYILHGRAEVIINGEKNPVESGEMIIMPANIPHALNARERFKMLLIMIRKKAD